ncbi:hypothetical protein F5Y17DRAFT_434186 [Xylariaceae sp. FL0594]|nr:hypothetical protein F5Y17DRAFT_434186 [Xylariaceae sp. FL0594]
MLASRSLPRAMPLQHATVNHSVLGSPGTSSLRSRYCLQIRTFRFGIWPIHVNLAAHRETRRRHRALKHRCAAGTNRRSPFDGDAFAEDLHQAMKKMASDWLETTSRCSQQWANLVEADVRCSPPSGGSSDTSGSHGRDERPGRWEMEEDESHETPRGGPQREGDTEGPKQPNRQPNKPRSSKKKKHERVSTTQELPYYIDPITNRKVLIDEEEKARWLARAEASFGPYVVPDTDEGCPPVHSNGKPPASELNEYSDVNLDDWSAPEIHSQAAAGKPLDEVDASRYVFDGSTLKSEEYALNHLPLDDPVEEDGDSGNRPTSGHVPEATSNMGAPRSELERYGPYHVEETAPQDAPSKQPNDLDQYRPTSFADTRDEDQPFQQYGDLEKYRALAYQDQDTSSAVEQDATTESLKEYDTKEQAENASEVTGKLPKMNLPEGHVFSNHYAEQDVGNRIRPPQNGNATREDLEQRMEDLNERSDAIDRDVNINLQKMRQGSRTDGHQTSFRLEPALNRRASVVKGRGLGSALAADLFSKEPQGLETSFIEECGGRQTMPIYTRAYGSEPGQVPPRSKFTTEGEPQGTRLQSPADSHYHRDPEIDGVPLSTYKGPGQSHTAAQPDEPTLYKVLVYDADTQVVSVVETTSVVQDEATPLTPTDVLPRLSHPTKFLPHLAPLQAEGFEITSGKGDVLVFRQVRPAKATKKNSRGPAINPIDMMGRPPAAVLPNAAAFVSPTGFINYDLPGVEEEEDDAEARTAFQSNINVRREEPVFSGPKADGSERKKKKKMGVGKRVLVGGVWVAGISYALTVIGEYFVTGGAEGTGPQGI